MLSNQIKDLADSISALAGTLDRATWEKMDIIRDNLRAIADQVHQVEVHFVQRRVEDGEENERERA